MASGTMASVVVLVALLLIAALLEAAARRELGPATMAEALGRHADHPGCGSPF